MPRRCFPTPLIYEELCGELLFDPLAAAPPAAAGSEPTTEEMPVIPS